MADVGEQVSNLGRPFGPAARQESPEVSRRGRLRRHGIEFRHIDAPHPARDTPAAEAEFTRDLRDRAASFVKLPDLIEIRLAGGNPSAADQAIVRDDLRAVIRLFDTRRFRCVLTIVDPVWRLPDRGFEAAELPFDRLAEILQQMKAIGDLPRLRRALTRGVRIKARAIAADNLDFRVPLEPCCHRRRGAIREQVHHVTPLQIHDHRAERHTFPPGPFIDAHNPERGQVGLSAGARLDAPQDRGVAHRHTKPGQQPLGRSPTRAVAEHPHDSGQAGRSAGKRRCQVRQLLGENPTITAAVPTSPARQLRPNGDWCAEGRKVTKRPSVGAVTGAGLRAAGRADRPASALDHHDPVWLASLYSDHVQIRRGGPRCECFHRVA
jgi:hypothetical protein